MSADLQGRHLLLFDGVCGLCNRLVHFVLRRDRRDRFRFAALQGNLAREVLARHQRDPARLDTVYLVTDCGTPGERIHQRSRAVLRVLRELGGGWRLFLPLSILPTPVLDLGYRLVARVRYRVFGRYDTCPVPRPEHRARILD
jgi:predicted DCC family thiol-disulfide oxidoreductase YuxK